MWHCVPNVFTFVAEKEHNFQKNESIACTPPYKKEKKKPDLSELTQIFCDLLFLLSNYFWAKIKCICAMRTVVSAAIVWSCYTIPSIPHCRERESITWQDQIMVLKGTIFTTVPLTERENQHYLSTVSCLKNIFPHNFTSKNKLKLYCISIRTQAKTNCDLKWMKKMIIFQRRFLVWLLICRLFTRNCHVIGLSPR